MSEQQPPAEGGPPPPGPQYGPPPSQPYAQPHAQPYSPYERPPRKRPRALWFAVGAVLVVLGLGIGFAVIVNAVKDATRTDGVITADGNPASIAAPPNETRMLFVESGHVAPNCILTDGSGQQLLMRAIFGDSTVTTSGSEWKAFSQIDSSGDGNIAITCTPTAVGDVARVRLGEPLDVASVGGAVLAGVGAILVLGGAGFVILLVTTILWFTRKPQGELQT